MRSPHAKQPSNETGVGTTATWIVHQPDFAMGVHSALVEQPPDYELNSWEYEKGRLFVAACRARRIKVPNVPSRKAITLFRQFHFAGDIPP